jgi:hypothetical protein
MFNKNQIIYGLIIIFIIVSLIISIYVLINNKTGKGPIGPGPHPHGPPSPPSPGPSPHPPSPGPVPIKKYGLKNSSGLIIVKQKKSDPLNPTFIYYQGTNKFDGKYFNGSNKGQTISNLNDFILQLYNFLNNKNPNDINITEDEFEYSQFMNDRYTFIFTEGTYDGINIIINYYTSFYGVDMNKVVLLNSSIVVPTFTPNYQLGALDNFWRSLENMTILIKDDGPNQQNFKWAVSQASPLRNVNIYYNYSLWFFDLSYVIIPGEGKKSVYASGGYASNIKTNASIIFGGQQQFCLNNFNYVTSSTNINPPADNIIKELCAWNTVLTDSKTDIVNSADRKDNSGTYLFTSYSYKNNTGKSIDKPSFYFTNENDYTSYKINIPTKSSNTTISSNNIFIAYPKANISKEINNALSQNIAVVLTPGFYKLDDPILITNNNSVILSLGMSTLENPPDNCALIINDNLTNVIISGFFIQANNNSKLLKNDNNCLIKIGSKHNKYNSLSTGFSVYLYDVFIRIGASNLGNEKGPDYNKGNGIKQMVEINSDNVIIENMWLWRADHTNGKENRDGIGPTNAYCENALVVNGNNVIIYGLACEHTLKDIVIWNGDSGIVNFYQCELPYDAPIDSTGLWNYSGFVINGSNFNGGGMGIYSYFTKKWNQNWNIKPTTCKQAILINSSARNITITNAFTVFLNNQTGQGGISNIINDKSCNKLSGGPSNSSTYGKPTWNNPLIYVSNCGGPSPPSPPIHTKQYDGDIGVDNCPGPFNYPAGFDPNFNSWMNNNKSCTRQAIGPLLKIGGSKYFNTWNSIHKPVVEGPNWNDFKKSIINGYNCGELLNTYDNNKYTCGSNWSIKENFADDKMCTVGKCDNGDTSQNCNPLVDNGKHPGNFGCTCPYNTKDLGQDPNKPGCIVTPKFNWIIGVCQGQTCNGDYINTKSSQEWKNIGSQLNINYIAAYNFDKNKRQWIMAEDSSFNTNGEKDPYDCIKAYGGLSKEDAWLRPSPGGSAQWGAGISPINAEGLGPLALNGNSGGIMFVLSTNKSYNFAFYMLNQATINRGGGSPQCDYNGNFYNNCWSSGNGGEIDFLESPFSAPNGTIDNYRRLYLNNLNQTGRCFPGPGGDRIGGWGSNVERSTQLLGSDPMINKDQPIVYICIVDKIGAYVYKVPGNKIDNIWPGLTLKTANKSLDETKPQQPPDSFQPCKNDDYCMMFIPNCQAKNHQESIDFDCGFNTEQGFCQNWFQLLSDTNQWKYVDGKYKENLDNDEKWKAKNMYSMPWSDDMNPYLCKVPYTSKCEKI